MEKVREENRTTLRLNDVECAELQAVLEQWIAWRDTMNGDALGGAALRNLAVELTHELEP